MVRRPIAAIRNDVNRHGAMTGCAAALDSTDGIFGEHTAESRQLVHLQHARSFRGMAAGSVSRRHARQGHR
jgi:hypothetical protein